MRPRIVASIFRKEIVETLRDRRTLFGMIVLPMLLQPVLMIVFGQVVATIQSARAHVKPVIAVWGPLPAAARTALSEKLGATFVDERTAPPPVPAVEARKLLARGRADLVLAVPPDAPSLFDGEGSAHFDLFYNSVNDQSDAARGRAEDVLHDVRDDALVARFQRHGLSPDFNKPLALSQRDIATQQKRGGDLAGRMLPLVLLLMLMLGAIYPCIDMTAGEKERGTMQTLLCAPIRPSEILAGKYLVAVLVAMTASAVNIAAMGFALGRQIAALDPKAAQFTVNVGMFASVFAAMIPAALLLSALLLAMSVFARSFREAQTYVTPVVTAMVLPGFIATIPSVRLEGVMAFVPVVNVALLLRDLLRGEAGPLIYVVVCGASLAYASVAVFFAAKVFASEQVLLGGELPWHDVFNRKGLTQVTPTPRAAVLFFVVLLGVVYYGSLWADPARRGFVGGLLAVQLGLILAPAVIAALATRVHLRETFSLRRPTPRALTGAALLAGGAWSLGELVTAAESSLFPGAKDYFEELTKLLGGAQNLPLGAAIVLLALVPAISEEACFRGFVMSGLANTGSRFVAIGGSALAFGILHLSPYHILPAAILGLALGYATLQSGSLLTGALVHFVNNALAVTAERLPSVKAGLESGWAIALGVMLSAAGLALLRNSREEAAVAPVLRQEPQVS